MKKKTIIAVLALLLAATAGFFGLKAYNRYNAVADVMPVAALNVPYYQEDYSTYGIVYDTDGQQVYVSPSSVITKVFVSEGQEVSPGAKLMEYDMTSLLSSIEHKELEISHLSQNIVTAKQELAKLKRTKPAPERTPEPEVPEETPGPEETPEPEERPMPEKAKDNDAWTLIDSFEDRVTDDADGTAEKPYRFIIVQDGAVSGSFLTALKAEHPDTFVRFETHAENTADSPMVSGYLLNTSRLHDSYEEGGYTIFHLIVETASAENSTTEDEVPWPSPTKKPDHNGGKKKPTPAPTAAPDDGSGSDGGDSSDYSDQGYTAAELAKLIKAKERELVDLDLSRRKAQQELKELQQSLQDGTVYAKKGGIVQHVGDPANPPQDGSAFIEITAGSGVYVQGAVSELQLDRVRFGQNVKATNWEDGTEYEGYVSSLDEYPNTSNEYYGGSGNPNASYYTFYAYFEEKGNLKNGSYLMINFVSDDDGTTGMICLDRAYVRKDAGGSYVMKDENGRLKKQYVHTGKVYYGRMIEIKDGLTIEDSIAFPYGSGGQEGAKTKMTEGMEGGMMY